jgi:hypothetical protein
VERSQFDVVAWSNQDGIPNATDIQIDHREHVFSPYLLQESLAPQLSQLKKKKKDHFQRDAGWMGKRQPKPGEQHNHPSSVVVGSCAAGHAIIMCSQDEAGPHLFLKPNGDIFWAVRTESLPCEGKGRIDLAQQRQEGVSASRLVCCGQAVKIV